MMRSVTTRGILAFAGLAVAAACIPPQETTPLGPMGKLPGIVTTAEPEWLPFAILAGQSLPEDARERRLGEPRRLDVGGEAMRVAWGAEGRSLLVQVRRGGAACEEVVEVDLGRSAAVRPVSAPGTRGRLGASLGPRGVLLAESPCAEAEGRASWTLVHVADGARRVVARPEGEVVGVASDGRQVFFNTRDPQGKGRLGQVSLDGGALRGLVEGTMPLGAPGIAPARASLLVVKETAAGGAQLVMTSDQGGDARPLSRGSARDVDPAALPDGTALVFASTRAGRPPAGKGSASADEAAQLYLTSATHPESEGGLAAERLTFASEDNRAPAIGPRGRLLAWVSDRGAPGGPRSVLVARFDGAP